MTGARGGAGEGADTRAGEGDDGARAGERRGARAALERLSRKYETLAELRRARARGEPLPERAVFRALAGEFPGALYELDRLPMEAIDERRSALSAALAGAPEAAWMRPMAEYHALYRAALYVKARARKGASPGAEEASSLAAAASRHAGVEVGSAFVRAVARPDGGRIGPVVMDEVAARHGAERAALAEALFPTRRVFSPPRRA